MDTDENDLPVPQEQKRVEGDERERLVEQILKDTDLSKIDQYIRNKGYVRNQPIVNREFYPDYSFDLLTVVLQYDDQGTLATAMWKGIPPDRSEVNEMTYEDIYEEIDLEEALEDTSLDKRSVLPQTIGFIDNGRVGLRITSDGITENEVDVQGVMEAAKEADWDEHNC
ncbi:hypothetical protein [Halomontanus rarus]|uniref:hypothetical protein n=1 Tax=Halomontanus rarus TaxID=3034020 RepID=UPI001A97F724